MRAFLSLLLCGSFMHVSGVRGIRTSVLKLSSRLSSILWAVLRSNATGMEHMALDVLHSNCEEQIKRRVPRGERVSLQAIENEMVAAVSDPYILFAVS